MVTMLCPQTYQLKWQTRTKYQPTATSALLIDNNVEILNFRSKMADNNVEPSADSVGVIWAVHSLTYSGVWLELLAPKGLERLQHVGNLVRPVEPRDWVHALILRAPLKSNKMWSVIYFDIMKHRTGPFVYPKAEFPPENNLRVRRTGGGGGLGSIIFFHITWSIYEDCDDYYCILTV